MSEAAGARPAASLTPPSRIAADAVYLELDPPARMLRRFSTGDEAVLPCAQLAAGTFADMIVSYSQPPPVMLANGPWGRHACLQPVQP